MSPRHVKAATKSPNAFKTISEVAEMMEVQQHVLRFWESKFSHIKPMKRGGGRRYYRPEDVKIIRAIRNLLHEDGYTIKGVQKLLREQGVKSIVGESENSDHSLDDMPVIEDINQPSADVTHLSVNKEENIFPNAASLARTEVLNGIRSRLDLIRQKIKQEVSN